MLVHLLRSHPNIWVNGEVFGADRVTGLAGVYARKTRQDESYVDFFKEERDANPERFLYKYALDPQGRQCVGFKLKSDELVQRKYKVIRDLVISDTDIKIIHLDRRNLLARYLSWHVAVHVTGVTLVTDENSKPKIEPVFLDIEECKMNFDQMLKRQNSMRHLFRKHRSVEIEYGDIVDNIEECSNRLCDFLDVGRRLLTTPTLKIIDNDLRNSISNYDEIVEHFRDTDYAAYIG